MGIPLLSSLFKSKRRDTEWFAVGFAAHGVYLVKVNLSGVMPRVERCEYHETSTLPGATLERLRQTANISGHTFTTVLAPGEYQMLLVEAPAVPVNELKSAIRWKIKDGLSYHIDDATVDVLQIPATKHSAERAQSLYAIVAENSVIQKQIALFEQAQLTLGVIDIPEMAQRNIAGLFEQEDRALVLLSFDDFGGLLTITAGGELYLSRRIEVSGGQLQDVNEELRQQSRDKVEMELQRSLDYFDRHFHTLPVKRVLVSAPPNTGLVDFLSAVVDVKVEQLDLSQVLDISAAPDLANSEFVAGVLPTLGAALRQESISL